MNYRDIHNHRITGARNFVSNNPDITALAAVNQTEKFLKSKCDKNGGAGTSEEVLRAMDEVIKECTKKFLDIGQQLHQMERHISPTLTKDKHLLFKMYCRYTPVFRKCASKFVEALEPCLAPQEKVNIKVFENITNALLSFACYKNGDHIIQFTSTHGIECVQSKQLEILQCVNTTFASYLPAHNPNDGSSAELDSPPPLVFGTKECTDITTVQSCVVNKLEECSDPTPANIVDSMFNVILEATPCKEFLPNRGAASTSTIILLATSTVFLVSRLI